MKRYILAGLVLAVLTAVITAWSLLGAQAGGAVLLGLALGGALGLVPHGSVAERTAGFVLGVVLAWAGYLARAAALPDAPAGWAVVAFVVLSLCVVAFAVSRGRLPLWSLLLGVVGVVGAYDSTYAADPTAVVSSSVEVTATLLLASAIGLLVGALLTPDPAPEPAPERLAVAAHAAPASGGTPASTPVTLHPLTRDPHPQPEA